MDTTQGKPAPLARAGRALKDYWRPMRPQRRASQAQPPAQAQGSGRKLSVQEQDRLDTDVQRAHERVQLWQWQSHPTDTGAELLSRPLVLPPAPAAAPSRTAQGKRPCLAERRGISHDELSLRLAQMQNSPDTMLVSYDLAVKVLTAEDGSCAGVVLAETAAECHNPAQIVVRADSLARLVQCLRVAEAQI